MEIDAWLNFLGWIIFLVLPLVGATTCYFMAKKRYRNPALGVLAGLLVPIIAILYYLLAGNKYITTKN